MYNKKILFFSQDCMTYYGIVLFSIYYDIAPYYDIALYYNIALYYDIALYIN